MLDIQNFIGAPKIFVTENDQKHTSFEVNYLPRGFGHTLGNALRRLILSYNLGAAVTGLKIKGVPHEYHTIEGVKENVITMMLNFKNLRFKFEEGIEEVQWVSQKIKGLGQYTADSLELPAGVELLNKDAYLFEITDPSVELAIEFRVEKGYRYYDLNFLREREKREGGDVGTLLIDNDFKLVDSVSYRVEEVIDDFTGATKESLVLDLGMLYDGVSAKEVVMFAGEVLASYAKLFIFDNVYLDRSMFVEYEDIQEEESAEATVEAGLKTMPIDALPLSERTRNALIKNDILYVEDLEKKKKNELLSMKGVGKKAIDEIQSSLVEIDKSLLG
ncbi:MAG: hypothetical protein CR971_02545 [candidate division SR1 bacterium]|nr:MAG: hypothetical protein CR971_02545 [candidate division SR1 bacterium]